MHIQPKILLTGATGLLGGAFVDRFDEQFLLWPQGFRHDVDHPNFVRVNLENPKETRGVLDSVKPDIIIHLAALANVDACEAAPQNAYRINVEATRTLVDWMDFNRPNGIFVYTSTDQIYDGPGPHVEEKVSPPNTYAITKLWGEDIVQRIERSIVLRLNFFAAPTASQHVGIVRWLSENLTLGNPINLFGDVLFGPIHALQAAEIIRDMINKNIFGVFNLGASDYCSKAGFAEMVAEYIGMSLENASVCSIDDVPMEARRPKDMRMSTERLSRQLGYTLPSIAEAVARIGSRDEDAKC